MYKVMVIDDEGNLRQALEQLLVSNGYAFCGARDAESGLELLASEHPDLLLLDVMLPGTNGFDLCARIREQGRRIPVIFLSAKCDIVDKSIGFRAGGDDYVTKPFDSTELLLRIEANIRRHKDTIDFARCRNREGVARIGERIRGAREGQAGGADYEGVRDRGVSGGASGQGVHAQPDPGVHLGRVGRRLQAYEQHHRVRPQDPREDRGEPL